MMHRPLLIIALFSFMLLASCRSSKKKSISFRTTDTLTVSAFNNPINIYRASATQNWQQEQTRVALSFDIANRTAKGQAWLTLRPYFYPTDSIVLDAKMMQIHSVTIGQNDKTLNYKYDSSQLVIFLGRPYRDYETAKICINYTATPYAAHKSGGSAAITDDRGLYFINHDQEIEGKPVQIWTQGETESNSHWLPCIDKPNSRTKIQLELTVPSYFKTLSNGLLVSSMEKGATRTDIWRNEDPIQVYAIMFAIGDFTIVKDTWRNKEVNYYVEPDYAPFAKTMFQHTPEMIEFFSQITGVPYPWEKYSQVVVRDYVSGAMENTSASLFGEFMNQDKRAYEDANHEDVVSHELFHQWFGDYVTAESWSNLTVNESFATYGEYLWRKHKYGKNYADELAYADLKKYLDYSSFSDPILVRHHYRDKEDMFDRVSYQKGGAILHYMQYLMGDTAFYKAMKIYLSSNALQAAEATHWRLAVEKATGQDWALFFDQWYHKGGHPILDIQYAYDDQNKELKVTVAQKQKNGIYQLPIECLLLYGKQKNTEKWLLNKAQQTFVYPYKNDQKPILVPDVPHVLPGVIKENKHFAGYLAQFRNTEDFISKLICINAVSDDLKTMSQPEIQNIISEGLQCPIAAIRTATLQKIAPLENFGLRNKWISDIKMIAQSDGNNQARAEAISLLGAWKIDGQQQFLLDAINDSSYIVAASALASLQKTDKEMAYKQAHAHLKGKANTALDIQAWQVIAQNAKTQDTSLMYQLAHNRNFKNYRIQTLMNLSIFAANTEDGQIFEKLLSWISIYINNDSNKQTRSYRVGELVYLKMMLENKLKSNAKNQLLKSKMSTFKLFVQQLKDKEAETSIQEQYQSYL